MKEIQTHLQILSVMFAVLFVLAGAAQAESVRLFFPQYTSLHDCTDLLDHGPLDHSTEETLRQACSDILHHNLDSSQEISLPEEYRSSRGFFGAKPLLFIQATMLQCDGQGCAELHDVRTQPPHMLWHPPRVMNRGDHLSYHFPPSADRNSSYMLQLKGLDRTWRSDRFSPALWVISYINVKFDREHPGHLMLERDWQRTLVDPENYRVPQKIFTLLEIWGILMLMACVSVLLLASISKAMNPEWFRTWRDNGRALIAHGLSLALLMAVLVLWPQVMGLDGMVMSIAIVFLYGCTLPVDIWWINKGGRLDWRQSLRLAGCIKAGVVVIASFTGMLLWWFML
ncbi:MAG: hypothetical protein R8K50_10400 [Mariprofundus sp.]